MEYLKTEDEKEQIKPFKVCFGKKNLIGRSNIQIGKPFLLGNLLSLCYIYLQTPTELQHFRTTSD